MKGRPERAASGVDAGEASPVMRAAEPRQVVLIESESAGWNLAWILPWGRCQLYNKARDAHGTEFREVLYRYHPWFGDAVGVHGVVAK